MRAFASRLKLQEATAHDINDIHTDSRHFTYDLFQSDMLPFTPKTFIAKHENTIVGFVQVLVHSDHEAEIVSLGIREKLNQRSLARSGIASALLGRANAFLIKQKVARVYLTSTTKGHPFYAHTNYRELKPKERKGAYPNYTHLWEPGLAVKKKLQRRLK